jgi:hypothetical protein
MLATSHGFTSAWGYSASVGVATNVMTSLRLT